MRYFRIAERVIIPSDVPTGQIVVALAPDANDRDLLAHQFRLDDYDLGSTLDPDEVARCESSDGRLLLIWKVPESARFFGNFEFGVTTLGICLIDDKLALIRSAGEVNLTEREFRGISNPRDVLLAVLLRTIRHFVAHLRGIRQLSAELEEKITISMENRHLLIMFSLSESLVIYQDAIESNAAMLAKLRTLAPQFGFDSRQLETLDDILLENTQAARQANIYASLLNGLMDARGTIVNNNMNMLLKNLTLINIVFLPLNLIASIGGMSEWSMMTAHMDWRLSYSLFCLGMVALGWLTWIFMKKVIDRGVVRPPGR